MHPVLGKMVAAGTDIVRCVLTLGLAAACGGVESDGSEPHLMSAQQAIVQGQASGYTGVVSLSAGGGNVRSGCSATLIAPNVVLTALHCVSDFNDTAEFRCRSDGSLDSVPPAGVIGAPLDPATVQIRAGATYTERPDALGSRVFGSNSTHICRHDIAVVVLDRDLEAAVSPLRFARPTNVGEVMTVIGYGINETPFESRFERSGVRVLAVGEVDGRAGVGAAAPDTFVLGEGACRGDSGGPALSEDTGAITGVYSIAAGVSCTATGVRNVYTSVAPFEALIVEALEWAGHEPRRESPVEPPPAVEPSVMTADEAPGSGSRRDPALTCSSTPHLATNGWWLVGVSALLVFRARRLPRRPSSGCVYL